MLNTLTFEAVFSSTGRKIAGNHDFQEGLTAISGANECGKSMRLEMIRYALFGTQALRSPIGNYKTLSAKLIFSVLGVKYSVERGLTQAKLYKGNQVVATGTRAVNEEVIKILGYDMSVFDSSNACLQGEVEALTQKTPAERKRMVDKTIGLSAIDTLLTEYGSEVSAINKTVGSLKNMLGEELIKPQPAPDYQPSSESAKDLKLLQIQITEVEKKRAQVGALKCKEPTPPELGVFEPLEKLQERYAESITYETTMRDIQSRLSAMKANGNVDITQLAQYQGYLATQSYQAWEEYQADQEKEARLRKHVIDALSDDELIEMVEGFKAETAYKHYLSVASGGVITCPHCHKGFFANQDEVEAAKACLYATWTPGKIEEVCKKARAYKLRNQEDVQEQRGCRQGLRGFLSSPRCPKPDYPDLGTRKEVELWVKRAEHELELAQTRQNLMEQLEELKKNPLEPSGHIKSLLAQAQREKQAEALYQVQLEQYTKYLELSKELAWVIPRAEELKTAYEVLEQRKTAAMEYEHALREYTIRQESRAKIAEELEQYEGKLDVLSRVRKALNEIKPKVKSYLIPSLSRVSSNFLSEMTNSARNQIDISEGFDIVVDGQPVETLSGSGKAVANLAVRLALGTVLTNKVFSVLLADEVDASMDDERSKYTAQCLRNLTKVFKQIILVSHHKLEADHQINL